MDSILCDELLEEVLRRLPPHSKFSSSTADVSLVSKRWLRLYRASKSRLSLRLSPNNCTSSSLSSFLSHFPYLSALTITTVTVLGGGSSGNDGDIWTFSDHLLLSAASSCPKLRYLRISPDPISLFPLLSLSTSCPRLTYLGIVLSRPLSFHWLVFFHSLKTLVVLFSSLPGEFKLVDASEGNFNAELKLETLALSGIRRGDYGLDWLWRSCKKLKQLMLHRCQGVGDDTSVSSFDNCFKGLQKVVLNRCGSIVDEVLMRLVDNCTKLKSLAIYHEGSKVGLLQFLTRSHCNLRKLDLHLPLDLENNHLLAVAEKFRGLSSLRLDSCFLVTGEGLKAIGLAMSNELEELALINCDVVEREPGLLTTLGQNLRKLRKLDLSDNDKLVDKEFISMLASCNCLMELKVRGCKGLTNASVVSMFTSCKQLEIVDMMNCPGIEAAADQFFFLELSAIEADTC